MAQVLPLTLSGDNLGQRHHCLNDSVNNTFQQNIPLQSILEQSEKHPIDRIFKIDLAAKYKNIDFIIENIKDKDMLYVSRALKCQWWLQAEYRHIINPVFLENCLYPHMITTAVNKMKHHIELNLKDPERCQEFYEYYKSDFDVSIKFLYHCSKEFIAVQVLNVIDRLTPKHLRILCEACPQVAKVYYDGLQNTGTALSRYLKENRKYFKSITNVLKVDGDLYLDLVERYFQRRNLSPLSPSSTRYVMIHYKNRYLNKPELYAGWLLNLKTLAMFLNTEEIKDVITRLAGAAYLGVRYTYKHAEPLIKRLSGEERTMIRKKIFVDKSFGNKIEAWPYPSPIDCKLPEPDREPFEDKHHYPYEYETERRYLRKCLKSKKFCSSYCTRSDFNSLNTTFDRYRFQGFRKVFLEFRKLLLAESTINGRRTMMLVLVSKAGGDAAKVDQLLRFLVERHGNEPEHLREAVARSIVKRAFAWRLPPDTWQLLLRWGTGTIREIIHTKILRYLLTNTACPPADIESYKLEFSDLTEYSLNSAEKSLVAERLPALLIFANAPELFLATIKPYNLRLESVPGAEDMLVEAARRDENILRRCFDLKLVRRHLLKESFQIVQTGASFMNALKHDVSVLGDGERLVALILKTKSNLNRFLRALVLYFSEPGGLASRHLSAIEGAVKEKHCESFARPLVFLLSVGNTSLMDYLEKTDMKSSKGSQRKFAAVLRVNAFVARPVLDLDGVDWRAIGAKFVSNKVLACRQTDVDKNIKKCLEWRNTMRVAVRLALRNGTVPAALANVARARPSVALKLFLSDLRKGTEHFHLWDLIEPIILNLDFTKPPMQRMRQDLIILDCKSSIKANYWIAVFKALHKPGAMPMLCSIENHLTEADDDSLRDIILDFIRDKLNRDLFSNDYPEKYICLYIRVIGKYLLTSTSVENQKLKIETVCEFFFDKLETICQEIDDKAKLHHCLYDFISSLKYSRAFLNRKYVSCIPMFEKILERLSKMLSRVHFFKKYVYIHITMLYYRSIRRVLEETPQLLGKLKSSRHAGVDAVGYLLGKYMGIEIKDLVQSYFPSVVKIYQKSLMKFIGSFDLSEQRETLASSMVRGLCEVEGDALLLAQRLYAKRVRSQKEPLLKLLKDADNEEMKFFLYAAIYPQ